ncbi:MAG TPA: hypothetical protein VMN58_06140 [Acidimicrobiales bacterium]|nr:hypothetical protein [Acidimicrobiales bacterium]
MAKKRRRRTRTSGPATRSDRPGPREVAPDEEPVDLADALGLSARDRAALAPNWRTPLRVDICIGLAVVFLGVSMLTGGLVVLGALLAAAGSAYAVLVVRRWRRWAAIRAEVDMDRRQAEG